MSSAGLYQLAAEVGNISRYLAPNASDRYATRVRRDWYETWLAELEQ